MQRRIALGLYRTPLRYELLDFALANGISRIDTAYNYHGGASLEFLRAIADDFWISSKIGYFPETSSNKPHHSLEIGQMRSAALDTANRIGRPPDLLMIHNPEELLRSYPRAEAEERLNLAAEELANLVSDGVARSWGISIWDARSASSLITKPLGSLPDYLMTRSGFSIGWDELKAVSHIRSICATHASNCLAASPFGGPIVGAELAGIGELKAISENADITGRQALALGAWSLPDTSVLCVSSSRTDHIEEVVGAIDFPVNSRWIKSYINLLSGGREF